jgi:hypothetical protein
MEEDEEDEEYEIIFEPDEALILALNEIDNLKQLIKEQSSSINQLKKDFLKLKKSEK